MSFYFNKLNTDGITLQTKRYKIQVRLPLEQVISISLMFVPWQLQYITQLLRNRIDKPNRI
ncbi:MAG: hypothetical protein LBJ89_05005 [Holosporales bacterium]|nr:hypothetical protein [Holosporales bacterium]